MAGWEVKVVYTPDEGCIVEVRWRVGAMFVILEAVTFALWRCTAPRRSLVVSECGESLQLLSNTVLSPSKSACHSRYW